MVLFWIAIAATVVAAQLILQPFFAAVATIAAIVLGAYSYSRFRARNVGISHALGVGIAWLALGIGTELVMAAHLGRGWYGVLGSPDHPLLRNVFFFVWIFSPALFARRDQYADAG